MPGAFPRATRSGHRTHPHLRDPLATVSLGGLVLPASGWQVDFLSGAPCAGRVRVAWGHVGAWWPSVAMGYWCPPRVGAGDWRARDGIPPTSGQTFCGGRRKYCVHQRQEPVHRGGWTFTNAFTKRCQCPPSLTVTPTEIRQGEATAS